MTSHDATLNNVKHAKETLTKMQSEFDEFTKKRIEQERKEKLRKDRKEKLDNINECSK